MREGTDPVKRAFDVIVASLALVLLSPLLLLVAVLIFVRLGRPVLFRQQRPGLGARPFTLVKFRTMTEATDDRGRPLPDEARMTALGSFLRRMSLDELPELWNVVKGDMSLVGPRPLLMEYLDLYSPEQARRHEVPPGVTGLVQVRGRNTLSWKEKLELDVWYVDNRTFWRDLRILVLTIVTVFTGRGVNQDGRATVDRFTGGDER